jgi:hypothetical protein
MVSRSFGCDPNRLRLLLDDQLPDDTQAEVAEHIETCRSCRRRLEALAAEARWWQEVQQFLTPEAARESPHAELQAPGAEAAGTAGGAGIPAEKRHALGFLAPSDDPRKLGRLGPYEIIGVIGSGGMGVVLKGFDSTLNRYVAVKVLSPQLASSAAARRRFRREAQAAAAIVHEHVVPIHAVDSAGGLPYLVMPFVAGQSLAQRIDGTGPLELKEILRIGMQAASGLAAAHAQGLVHRDVKPANILLENGVERVLITDFGLARTVDDASLTQSGVLAGTPQYMAPEQAKGETVDPRADLFSLGSVMYAMCTGRSPFRAETTMGVLHRICEVKPRPVREINPEIPDWLAEIIRKLHEKDPNDRFQSAAEVAELLGKHLAHLQHPAAVPMPERVKGRSAWARGLRARTVRLVIAAVMLVLIGGLAATEMLRITRVAGFVADLFEGRNSERPAKSTGQPDGPAAQEKPQESEPAVTVVPSHLLPWEDGLEDEIDDVRQRVGELEDRADQEGRVEAPPDWPAVIDRRLDELEQELSTELP